MKLENWLMIGTILLAGLLLYMIKAGINILEIVYALFIILMIGSSGYMIQKRKKDIKKGLPVSDELAKKVSYKAGAFTYFITIWIAVIALWYNGPIRDWLNLPELTLEYLVGIIVLGSGGVFLGLAFYFNSKGDV
ncbi:MAG: hypothetical protein ABIC04_03660 [Nanoarchaeota archaeon]